MYQERREHTSGEMGSFGEAMRQAAAAERAIAEKFPHSQVFVVELATPEEEAALLRADAWLSAGNAALGSWVGTSDPAGFTYCVRFREAEDLRRFLEAVRPPSNGEAAV